MILLCLCNRWRCLSGAIILCFYRWLDAIHNPSAPGSNSSSSRAGRSKNTIFFLSSLRGLGLAQVASKYIRLLPLAATATTTTSRVLLLFLQLIRRFRLQGPTHTSAKNDDTARLIYHTVTDDSTDIPMFVKNQLLPLFVHV